jgi:hypothetical protein
MAFSRLAESSARAPWLVAVATMAADAAIAKTGINARSLVLFMSILHGVANNLDTLRNRGLT